MSEFEEANGVGAQTLTPDDVEAARERLQDDTPRPLPRLSVEEFIAKASRDRKEEVVELPELGGSVKIRALSAAQDANVNQQSAQFNGNKTVIDFAAMERLRFQFGVIEPEMSADQVRKLHIESGPSFQLVLRRINELSGTTEKDQKESEAAFPEA